MVSLCADRPTDWIVWAEEAPVETGHDADGLVAIPTTIRGP